jgi:excisionase family DNA binding protein
MKAQEGRRLAGGRGNGGAVLERGKHSATILPRNVAPLPGTTSPAARRGEASGEPLLYTVPAAAHKLSLSRAEGYREIARGSLVSVQIGRCRRISHMALQAYVDRLEQGGDE